MKRFIFMLAVLLGNLGILNSQTHFSPIWSGNGYDQMNFYVTSATINGINIQSGDEIAVFDGGNCVGVGLFSGSYDVRVKASKDDPTTLETDGFIEGHSYTFRIWDASEGTEVTSVSVSVSSGSSVFTGSGTAFVSLAGTVACTPPPAPSVGTITQPTCAVSTGSVELSGLPASGTWTLIRTPGGTTYSSTGTSYTVTDLPAGATYTFTVTNAIGCISGSSSPVVINAQPVIPAQPGTISGNATVCQGTSQTYNITPVSGATSYTWTLPAGWSGSSTTTSITATAGSSGNISVTANNSCGSGTARTLAVTVNVIPAQPGSITGSTDICQGSSQTYSIAAVSGATSYTWTLPAGWSGSSTNTSITATAGSSGNISVTANNSCGSGAAATLAVTVTALPAQPGTITGSAAVCQGSSQTYSIAAVSGATSYTWTLPAGWSGTSTTTSITATAGSSGNISVTANNSCGSGTARTLAVTVSSTPAQPGTITGSTAVCQSSSQTYSITPVSGATSYTWTLPGGWTGSSTTASITATAGNAGGTISVTASNACGTSAARTLDVTVTPTPVQPDPITGGASVCQGSSQTYSIPAVSGATSYTWTLPAGWSGTSTTTSITATAGSGGNISVTANNSCGSGTARTLAVTVTALPAQPGTITGSAAVCQGSSQTYSIAAVSGATSYTWTLPAGWSGSSITTSITATAGSSGNISVTANNSCGSGTARTLSVTVSATPAQPGTISGTAAICQGSSQTYSITPVSGATSYTWTLPAGWSGSSTTTSITATAGSAGGTISVTASNACGTSAARTLDVTVTPLPVQPDPITGEASVCQSLSQTYSIPAVSGATSYTWTLPAGWSGSSTTTSITATAGSSGNISVAANNSCGSGSARSLAVTVTASPAQPGAITGSAAVCQGSSQTYSITPVSGATSYTWTLPAGWSGSSTTASITVTAGSGGGNISVTANNSCGAGAARTLAVTITAPPVQPGAISGNDAVCQGSSQTYSITPVSGATVYTWVLPAGWSGSSATESITATAGANGGIISVTASNVCGTSAERTLSVSASAVPSAPVIGTITQPNCTVATGSVELTGLPASGSWTITRLPGGATNTGTGTSTTVSGLTASTTYTFTVTNSTGCISASSGNAVINIQPLQSAPSVGTITQPTCSVSTGSVVLNGLPASGTWILTKTPGGTTSSGTGTSITLSGLTAGTYTYTVTNESGCTSPSTADIVINTQPVTPTAPTVGAITQPSCSVGTGSVVLNGLPSTGTWTLTRNPGGITSSGTGTSATISGLAAGTYTFTVTNVAGCVSEVSENVVINVNPATPAAPVVGAITQPPTSAGTGSVLLSGLPATGSWTLTRSPGGNTTTGTGTTANITGLSPGTYTFTVTNASGCVSPASSSVFINAVPTITGQHIVTVLEDHSLSITTAHLFITDPDNTPSQMTVSIGTGSNYSVSGGNTITPSLNFYGILTVPVTINDGIATSNPFGVSVTVTPVNDKPVITKMPNHSIERDSAFAVINLDNLAEDVETVDSLLTWSLTGYKSLNIAIDNRKVTLTAPNANWTGSDTIIFTVTDNDATTPQSAKDTVVFTITEITGLIDQESLKAIVYPVPTDGMVTILFDKPGDREVVLEVLSVQGKVVYIERQKISNDRVYLNLQKLYSGTYFIRMQIDKAVRIFTIIRK